jgi:hypothetical protein
MFLAFGYQRRLVFDIVRMLTIACYTLRKSIAINRPPISRLDDTGEAWL